MCRRRRACGRRWAGGGRHASRRRRPGRVSTSRRRGDHVSKCDFVVYLRTAPGPVRGTTLGAWHQNGGRRAPDEAEGAVARRGRRRERRRERAARGRRPGIGFGCVCARAGCRVTRPTLAACPFSLFISPPPILLSVSLPRPLLALLYSPLSSLLHSLPRRSRCTPLSFPSLSSPRSPSRELSPNSPSTRPKSNSASPSTSPGMTLAPSPTTSSSSPTRTLATRSSLTLATTP